MPVHRSGPTPAFFEYVTTKALVPLVEVPSADLTALATGEFAWVEIPRFQRGISWKMDNIHEFLDSSSVLLGNVILAQFNSGVLFPKLPPEMTSYTILVDGLQRFAVGTMLLAILHPLVLSPTPVFSSEATYFAPLRIRVGALNPVYLHNDLEFRQHPRVAISSQYSALRASLEQYINWELQQGHGKQLARRVVETFLNRQVAIDTYFNFTGPVQLMNTFLGINTVRVDLGPVDLLRAQIIERAASSGWTAIDIEEIENYFTDTFTVDEKPDTELLPFASAVLKCLGETENRVFPSWKAGLLRTEVEYFLDFVNDFKGLNGLSFFYEIRECGSIPFAILIAYYYVRSVHAGQPKPTFLLGGTSENPDLHRFLIACYRALFNGSIGRTRIFAEGILDGTLNSSLSDLADSLSKASLGISVQETTDLQWLLTFLNRADKNKAKRVFNAMLLPERNKGFGIQPFACLRFGRGASAFHIDHLIPERMLISSGPGFEEGSYLRNLAPLPGNQNQVAKATSCSAKLAPSGVYATYLASGGTMHPAHPYCDWLVKVHAPTVTAVELDRQELLEPHRHPDIGDRRIQLIASVLRERI